MIVRPNAQKTSGWEWFAYQGPRTPEDMGAAFAEMLPNRVKLLRYEVPEQCTHINDLQHALHPTLPTLIGFSKRLKFVPAFMKSLSEDLKGSIMYSRSTKVFCFNCIWRYKNKRYDLCEANQSDRRHARAVRVDV